MQLGVGSAAAGLGSPGVTRTEAVENEAPGEPPGETPADLLSVRKVLGSTTLLDLPLPAVWLLACPAAGVAPRQGLVSLATAQHYPAGSVATASDRDVRS